MNEEHMKKMIAPIIVTVLVILYYVLYFGILIYLVPGGFKIIIGIIPLIFTGLMIYVCVERIKEINGGEEDDLGKY